MERLTSNLANLLLALPFFALLVATLLLGKLFYARTSPYHFDAELTERDNGAFGVHLALYLLGLTIAAGGTLYRGRFFDLAGFVLVAAFCALCVVLMRLGVWVNDRFLLREFCVVKEMVQDRNAGTGFVVGGSCVATGLMINGSLSVEAGGDDLGTRAGHALLCTLVFFVLGQALLLAGAWAFRRLAGYDVHRAIEQDDNMAAGIAYGGFLVGLGLVVRSSLVDAAPDLGIEVVTTLVYAALGLVLLLATRVVADRVLLASPLRKEVAVDRNPAAAAVAAACWVCIALAFASVVTAHPTIREAESETATGAPAVEQVQRTSERGKW